MVSTAGVCMYLLTIRDGLVTRHIGPYESPKQASDDLDRLLEELESAPARSDILRKAEERWRSAKR